MGEKKIKKSSSGNADAHKAKMAKDQANRPIIPQSTQDKKKK